MGPKSTNPLSAVSSETQRHTGHKPVRTHDGKVETIASNIRWYSDSVEIQCWNGELLQVAFSFDYHDCEMISWVTSSQGIDRELIWDLMTETIELRLGAVDRLPHPIQWLSDNGPCYSAHQTILYGRSRGLDARTTTTYDPEKQRDGERSLRLLNAISLALINSLTP